MVIEEDKQNKCYNCFEIGQNDQTEEKTVPKIFVLFTSNVTSGHFELLDTVKPKSPSIFENGKFAMVPTSNEDELFIRLTEKNNHNKMDTICEICKQYCSGKEGSAIHISKKHKTQRKKVVKKYDTTTEMADEEEDQHKTDQLENDKNIKFWSHFEHEFEAILLSSDFDKVKTDLLVESNPERESKRDRRKRKQKHHRDWIQWLYYNQRKKAVRLISDDKDNVCTIELSTIFEKFNERWGTENTKTITQDPIPSDTQILDDNFEYNILVEYF